MIIVFGANNKENVRFLRPLKKGLHWYLVLKKYLKNSICEISSDQQFTPIMMLHKNTKYIVLGTFNKITLSILLEFSDI